MLHLKGGVDEVHELLQGAVQGWARHAGSSQELYRLYACPAKVNQLAVAQHIGVREEAADVGSRLLALHDCRRTLTAHTTQTHVCKMRVRC